MPKKRKRSRRASGTSVRVRLLLGSLIILLVAGVVLVKFFQTPRGRIFLLDNGFREYYSQVQQEIEPGLREALEHLGLHESLKERLLESFTIEGRRLHVRKWTVSCSDCSLVEVNLGITRAVKQAGAVVRLSLEQDEGNLLTLSIGSAKYTTHSIEVWRGKPPKAEPIPAVAGRRPATGRLAIVIDDFGYSQSELVDAFFTIRMPLTIAVIPSLPYSRSSLKRARRQGKQTILHVPMEAEAHKNSSPAVMTAMSDADIIGFLTRYLDIYPGVLGISNHMGSKATCNRRTMDAVMTVLKTRELFFLDSLTSSRTVAYSRARQAGVPTAKNNVSLDADTDDPFVVRERIKRLIRIAQKNGSAIGIGHPKPWTYEAISEMGDLLDGSGVELVFVSELMK
jgi:polysaccharide deacetylase 2 family uncharacterized protein YibQ